MKLRIKYKATVESEVEVEAPNHLRLSGLDKFIQGEAETHAYKKFFPEVVSHAEVRVDHIKFVEEKSSSRAMDSRELTPSPASTAMAEEDRAMEDPGDLGSGL